MPRIDSRGSLTNKKEDTMPHSKAMIMIDLDADPFVPKGASVVEHRKGGQFIFQPNKILLSPCCQNGKSLNYKAVYDKVKDLLVLNANMLDFYLEYPHFIPEAWKGKKIIFGGTIYKDKNGSFVRCLDCDRTKDGFSYAVLKYDDRGNKHYASHTDKHRAPPEEDIYRFHKIMKTWPSEIIEDPEERQENYCDNCHNDCKGCFMFSDTYLCSDYFFAVVS